MAAAPFGHFCWPECFIPDLEAAKAFYGRLFGWHWTEVPTSGGAYALAHLGDEAVGAAFQAPPSLGPPRWNSYVQVANADASAERARTLGGTVTAEPFDVPGAGRMAFLQDPGGASLALWQSGAHAGATGFGTPGCLCWTELSTHAPTEVKAFYGALFGWRFQEASGGPGYTEIHTAEGPIGGIYVPDRGDVPSRWLPYFAVADCDTTARVIAESGGKILAPPADIPGVGRFAYATDPGGAAFHLLALRPR